MADATTLRKAIHFFTRVTAVIKKLFFNYNSEQYSDDNCQTSGKVCYRNNDEARSLLITGFSQPNTRVRLFDSSCHEGQINDEFSVK